MAKLQNCRIARYLNIWQIEIYHHASARGSSDDVDPFTYFSALLLEQEQDIKQSYSGNIDW